MNFLYRVFDYIAAGFKALGLGIALALGLLLFVTAITTVVSDSDGNYSASIVKVTNAAATGGGTGWIARSGNENVIVTNAHVCQVAQGGFARIEDDRGAPYMKRVLRENFERDLCVLEGIPGRALPLADAGPTRFQRLQVYGHPGLRPTAPSMGYYTGPGIVPIGFGADADGSCPDSAEQVDSIFGSFCVLHMELGYTTVPIMPGNSGSPVTNEAGEVVGVMNSADSVGNQGMFIPLPYVKEILEE